jgi:hypothetical protein
MEYSPFHKGILLWDRGVGRVFLRDSLGITSRLDASFNHQNQHSHAPWIDPQTGQIYAFGGYGLFTNKSIITKFDSSAKEWDLVTVANEPEGPAPQSGAFVYTDFTRRDIYLIANRSTRKEALSSTSVLPDQRAVWRFHLDSKVWERVKLLDPELRVTSTQYQWLSNSNNSVHPEKPFFLYQLNDVIGNSEFAIFDIETGNTKNLMELNPRFKVGLPIINITWSERDQVFYALTLQVLSAQNDKLIRLFKIEIQDYDSLLRWLNENESSHFEEFATMLALVLLLIPGAFWVKRRRDSQLLSKTATTTIQNPRVTVAVTREGGFKLSSNGFDTSDIPTLETKLLELLVKEFQTPGSFLKSDDIDASLLPDHPSPDYIRRTRNLTLERLEALFQSVCELDNGQKYILRRSMMSDKRKNEYRLNDKVVKL